jgi:hypothetical protein
LRQREPAPRKLLGVELLLSNLSLDLGDAGTLAVWNGASAKRSCGRA